MQGVTRYDGLRFYCCLALAFVSPLLYFFPSVVMMSLWAGAVVGVFAANYVDRLDRLHRGIYQRWANGSMPARRHVASKSRFQLSLRAVLVLMLLVALVTAFLQRDTFVNGLVLGAGFVLTGVILGLDYEPKGTQILRGRVWSATVGGLIGAAAMAVLLVVWQLAADLSWPRRFFWWSIFRLYVLWSCLGGLTGLMVGTWVSNRPFRRVPEGEASCEEIAHFHAHIPAERRHLTAARWGNYLPAILASCLAHLSFYLMQAGLFDVGNQAAFRNVTPNEGYVDFQVSLMGAEEATEPEVAMEVAEPESEVGTPVDLFETRENKREGAKINVEEEAMEAGQSEQLSLQTGDELARSGQGTLGPRSSDKIEISLDGQSVFYFSKMGGVSFGGVKKLKIVADGKRVYVRVDNDAHTQGGIVGYELPLDYLTVEFGGRDEVNQGFLATKTFVRVSSEITDRPLAEGEARIVIGDEVDRQKLQAIRGMSSSARFSLSANRRPQAMRTIAPTRTVLYGGRCPVKLIDEKSAEPTKGDRWVSNYESWMIRFSSSSAQRVFLSNPEKYLPVMGGLDVVAAVRDSRVLKGTYKFGLLQDLSAEGGRNRYFLFASAKNRAAFQADTDVYLRRIQQVTSNPR